MPRERALYELGRMLRSMQHEPFYVCGQWQNEKLGLYIGWVERQESCIPDMPLYNETLDKTLIFSGEEFPESDVEAQLARKGHATQSGPLPHLIHVAEEESDFPASLNGQFQGVLCDLKEGTAALFNDRYGLRRIYVHQGADAFYFAAEAKAILAVRPELRVLDPQGMGEFFSCGCVLENRTLFKGIHLLPCASRWVFRNGALESRGTYFSRSEWEDQGVAAVHDYYRDVSHVFQQNLPRYFAAIPRVGLSLTGGLDTRMILAWHRPVPRTLPCYTFGGSNRECRDVRIARAVANACGQTHRILTVGNAFLADFPLYAARSVFLTDGAAGVHHAPDLYVNCVAREIAPIRMTGNYGDQVLRHLTVFRPHPPEEDVFDGDFLPFILGTAETYSHANSGHALTLATTNQTSWHYYGILALESSQITMRTPYLDNSLVRTLYTAPPETLSNNDLRVQLIRDGNRALGRIRTDLGFAGRGGALASTFSQQLHRFTMRAEYACEHGSPRWITQIDHRLLGRQLEKTFVGRHKFTHFALWYRNELSSYVKEILLDERTLSRSYLKPEAVREMVRSHLSGDQNHTPAIHKLMTLEHVQRLFIDTQ